MKNRGFTLIELLVVITIIGILAAIALPIFFGKTTSNSSVTWGFNGVTESRCIDGYKFVVDQTGNARQMLDEFGKGVRCEAVSRPGGF